MLTFDTGYDDIGDCDIVCNFCGAKVWYGERSDKGQKCKHPEFSICCMKGKVQLPLLSEPPELLRKLFSGEDKRSNNFFQNIRSYNNMFAFTSMGGKVETLRNDGRSPPSFVISGQNYHRIGTLLPSEGERPKFAQLYIYDTQNELSNRLSYYRLVFFLFFAK